MSDRYLLYLKTSLQDSRNIEQYLVINSHDCDEMYHRFYRLTIDNRLNVRRIPRKNGNGFYYIGIPVYKLFNQINIDYDNETVDSYEHIFKNKKNYIGECILDDIIFMINNRYNN